MDARCIGCALNPGSKVGREALVALNIVDIICALNNDRCCYKKKIQSYLELLGHLYCFSALYGNETASFGWGAEE